MRENYSDTPPRSPRCSCWRTLTSLSIAQAFSGGFYHEGGLRPAQVLSHPTSVKLCWSSVMPSLSGGAREAALPGSPLDRTCPALASQGYRIQGTAVVAGPGVYVQVPGLLEDCLVYLTRN